MISPREGQHYRPNHPFDAEDRVLVPERVDVVRSHNRHNLLVVMVVTKKRTAELWTTERRTYVIRILVAAPEIQAFGSYFRPCHEW